ncbi:LexA family transcriptional regulator [Chitiniphilus eburneus]|uniref:LexA family transcriptional regulator n=2 Tax=Chitiniphilus eburneus TaxID=2571148 RepID=A0A4U0PYP9_9NEIS|nr:LexA family transcriptional regulator [Chitiniphilus eburneus]
MASMSTFSERVARAVSIVGNMSRLAERVSVLSGRKVSPQTIRYLVKGDSRQGNKSPSSSELSPWIAQAAGLSLDWLVTGRGEVFDASTTPRAEGKGEFTPSVSAPSGVAAGATGIPWAVVRSTGDHPVLESEPGTVAVYSMDNWIAEKGLNPSDLLAMDVQDDSMAPAIPAGARVVIQRTRVVQSGRVHVLWRDGECYLRRVFKQFDGALLIASENKTNNRDVVLRNDELAQVHLLGLVVSVAFDI